MHYLDIHTHYAREAHNIDSRVSYRPIETLSTHGFYSIGLHPCYPEDMTEEAYALLCQRITREPMVWAIGECGLDKYSQVDFDIQKQYFIKQIELSELTHKPLIIHCVKAYNELLNLKKNYKPTQPWLIHGFRKNKNVAEQLIKAGCFLSFGQYYNPEALTFAFQAGHAFLETDMDVMPIEDVYQKVKQTLEASSIMEISLNLSIFAPKNNNTYEQKQERK